MNPQLPHRLTLCAVVLLATLPAVSEAEELEQQPAKPRCTEEIATADYVNYMAALDDDSLHAIRYLRQRSVEIDCPLHDCLRVILYRRELEFEPGFLPPLDIALATYNRCQEPQDTWMAVFKKKTEASFAPVKKYLEAKKEIETKLQKSRTRITAGGVLLGITGATLALSTIGAAYDAGSGGILVCNDGGLTTLCTNGVRAGYGIGFGITIGLGLAGGLLLGNGYQLRSQAAQEVQSLPRLTQPALLIPALAPKPAPTN